MAQLGSLSTCTDTTTVLEETFLSGYADIRCHVRALVGQMDKAFDSQSFDSLYEYKRADFNGLRISLRRCDWSLPDDLTVNDAVGVLHSILQHLFRTACPH